MMKEHQGRGGKRYKQRSRASRDVYPFIPKFTQLVLECEIIGPVHVGAGEEIPVYEYVISDGLLHKINLDKVIAKLTAQELSTFNSLNEAGDFMHIRSFLAEKYKDKKFRDTVVEFSIAVTSEVEGIYQEKIGDAENQLLIKLNQRNPLTHQPIIPGSSIKGAIRTALLAALEKKYDGKVNGKGSVVEGRLLAALNKPGKGVDATRDPFKHLKVEDVSLPANSTYITKVKNAIRTEKGFDTIDLQMIHEVTHSVFSNQPVQFKLNLLLSSEMKIFNNKPPMSVTADDLIHACRVYYKDRLELIEGKYFVNTPVQGEIDRIHNAVDYSQGEFLLRVGRFSGKMSITLDKHRQGPEPKSRNLADGKYPMGWIKCKVVE